MHIKTVFTLSFLLWDSANSSNPAGISKFRQTCRFSVLTSAQSLSSFTNVLPNMQADRQICQFSVLTSTQSLSTFTNVLPSMQAENCQLGHRSCLCTLHNATSADVSNFRPVLAYFVFILLFIMTMGFCLRFHVFAVLNLSLSLRLLQTLSLRCATQIWHLLNSCIFFPVASSATTLLPVDVSSSDVYIGGGCSRIAWATVRPYAVSQPSTLHDRSFLCYVAYGDKVDVKAYPNDRFVHADIPPFEVSQLLSLTVARSIAASHGIATGSRCNVAHLRSLVERHECVSCPSYLVMITGDPRAFFLSPAPVPANTRTSTHGYGFPYSRVRVHHLVYSCLN
jgi:hypothetical protein